MKRSDWLLFLLLLLAAILFFAWLLSEEDEESNDSQPKSPDTKESFLIRLEKRISKINSELEEDRKALQLSEERSRELDVIITRWLIGFNIVFILISLGIFYLFLRNDNSILNAILATIGIQGAICGVLCLFCFFKIMDPNVILDWVRERIKKWVYSRHKHDPNSTVELTRVIEVKTQVRDALTSEKDNL